MYFPNIFSCIFKRKQKSISEHFPVISWKALVKGIREDFSKSINNLEAKCLRSGSFSMCPFMRYGLISREGRETQVLDLSQICVLWVSFLCLGKWNRAYYLHLPSYKMQKTEKVLEEKDINLYNLQSLWMLNYRTFLFLHNWLSFKYSLCIFQVYHVTQQTDSQAQAIWLASIHFENFINSCPLSSYLNTQKLDIWGKKNTLKL